MTGKWKEIQPSDITDNVFTAVGTEWMLISAGSLDNFNTMTASWGGMGVLWGRQVAFAFVRPARYTYQFTESSHYFSLSFFPEGYKDTLMFCGSNSGRDVDKMQETGLVPVDIDGKSVGFRQSRLLILCRKLYHQDITPGLFDDKSIIDEIYTEEDFHRMYIAEISACYRAD
jgi:flavin reductase (DIM6/NTAB) family NADH-FMN oxidoreductase RutF